jgi:hypothetical protein
MKQQTDTAIADQAIRTIDTMTEDRMIQSVITFLDGLRRQGLVRFSIGGGALFEMDNRFPQQSLKAFSAYYQVMESMRNNHPEAYYKLNRFVLLNWVKPTGVN